MSGSAARRFSVAESGLSLAAARGGASGFPRPGTEVGVLRLRAPHQPPRLFTDRRPPAVDGPHRIGRHPPTTTSPPPPLLDRRTVPPATEGCYPGRRRPDSRSTGIRTGSGTSRTARLFNLLDSGRRRPGARLRSRSCEHLPSVTRAWRRTSVRPNVPAVVRNDDVFPFMGMKAMAHESWRLSSRPRPRRPESPIVMGLERRRLR